MHNMFEKKHSMLLAYTYVSVENTWQLLRSIFVCTRTIAVQEVQDLIVPRRSGKEARRVRRNTQYRASNLVSGRVKGKLRH